MTRRGLTLALGLLAISAWAAQATDTWGQVRAYRCRQAGCPPVIDGRLDDACWQAAQAATGFVAVGAEPGQPAPVQTTVRFTYDDEALYVAFECREPNMGALTSERRIRDFDVYNEDMVGLLLDVGHQRLGHYDMELAVSAAGTVYDFAWGQEEAWNGEWTAAVDRDDQAGIWRVEMRIPAADTRRAPRPGDIWGVQAMRWRRAGGKEEATLWSPVPERLGEMWSAPTFGHLLFDTGDRLVKDYVAKVARTLRARKPETLALVRGREQAEVACASIYTRLEALQTRATQGGRLTGDQWSGCFTEADRLLLDLDNLVWPLRIERLLEE